MSEAPPVTVILNQRHAEAWRRLGHDLARSATVIETDMWMEGAMSAEDAAYDGASMVVAAGGDGTIRSVAAGLLTEGTKDERPVLGVLPLGHGNDVARALSEHPTDTLDVGRVFINDADVPDIFVNSLGIGLEGRVAKAVTFGPRIGYTLAALATVLFGRRSWDFVGTIDDEPFAERLSVLSLGNSHSTGGGYRLTPDARVDDGVLDYCAASIFARTRLLGLMRRARRGKHLGAPGVTTGQMRTLHLRPDPAVPVHADGECLFDDAHEIRVDVLPAALRVRLLA